MTVVSFAAVDGGTATGSVSGSAATPEQVTALVEAADAAARAGSPAEDAGELVGDVTSPDWDVEPETTDIGVYDAFAPALGEAFREATAEDRLLYGFVNHDVSTTYLGSTRGLRLRHVQPTGHYALHRQGHRRSPAARGPAARPATSATSMPPPWPPTVRSGCGWAERRIDLPAGRYDTILPPSSVADLMIDAYWGAGARVAHEGESVYSRRGGGTRIGDKVAAPA